MEPRNAPFFNNEDRISKLPETLIHYILSFLDKKCVIKTSILARRWRYLWTSLPTLNFIDSITSPGGRKTDGFIDFVDRVLILRDGSDIQKFNLVWLDILDKDCNITHIVNTWIFAAIRLNVQELSLKVLISIDQIFQFPPCLFICKSLTELELDMGSRVSSEIILPNSICLPRLKSLKLDSTTINDENLTDKLFSSCTVLESLIISDCRMNINISSLKLRYFKLEHSFYDSSVSEVKSVKLYAPNLTSFSCKSYMSYDYSLENLSSLDNAVIDMIVEEKDEKPETFSMLPAEVKELYAQNMMKLLRGLHHVKDLTLSQWFLEVVSRAPGLLDNQLPQFANLRCLKLDTWLSRDCFHAITYLLKISPNIESLSLAIIKKSKDDPPMYPYIDEIKFDSGSTEDYWEAGWSLPFMLYHLKSVEIRRVSGCVNELKFLEILLKYGMVLDKVVLFSSWEGPGDIEGRLMKFTEKLQTFPRACSRSSILFF